MIGFLNLNLAKLRYVEFHEREIEGRMEKCISIPLRINGIREGKKGNTHLYALLKEAPLNNLGRLYSVVPYISDKKLFARLLNSGWWKQMYYFGDVRRYTGKTRIENNKRRSGIPLEDAMERD